MKQAIQRIVAGWLLCVPALGVSAPAEIPVRVMGNRVNIRARPGVAYEVVSQAGFRDVLRAKAIGEDWVEIYPPDGVQVWIHGDYVVDGRVSVGTLNLRCGPGIAYSKVGELQRNDRVAPLETFGDWIALHAPPSCSFWISREYVELVEKKKPPPEPPPVAEPPPPSAAVEQPAPPKFPPRDLRLLDGLHLIPEPGQGKEVERTGILRPVSFLLGRPASFRLAEGADPSDRTRCYLLGDDREFELLQDRTVRVFGRVYHVREARHPVVVVDRIDVE